MRFHDTVLGNCNADCKVLHTDWAGAARTEKCLARTHDLQIMYNGQQQRKVFCNENCSFNSASVDRKLTIHQRASPFIEVSPRIECADS